LRNIVIIGGGLAGLITSIQLTRAGVPCTLIEKKSYPLHRVCGEYISNEALPFLKRSGLYPEHMILPQINFFQFSSVTGRTFQLPLDLGGFGISRYAFDYSLYKIAVKEGVRFELNTEVNKITFHDDVFSVQTQSREIRSDLVIGAFGKRSKIDIQLNRAFIKKRSPFVGVKYHIRCNHQNNLISLHNFPGGYCGVCNVEDGITNLCYLSHRDNLREHGDIPQMEKAILFQNPFLKKIFETASFLYPRPEVINEISFETKSPVENHILMAGDAAGMITPLCGNGMAIAIHSGKMISELVTEFSFDRINRIALESQYRRMWHSQFNSRLWVGRQVQKLFGNAAFSNAGVNIARYSMPLAKLIVSKTHGQTF
jgi:flavin-dependent dehydrogenase